MSTTIKFTASDYENAHIKLDDIFNNGVYAKASTSVCSQCKGRCCYGYGEGVETARKLFTMCWKEHVYFKDPEFELDSNNNFLDYRQDRANCSHKPLLCKLHPFYPKNIHLLEEECNYAIVVADYHYERRLCADICKSGEVVDEQLSKLSEFYQWLYAFPENRMTYFANHLVYSGDSIDKGKFMDAVFSGCISTANTVYRKS